MNWLDKQVSIYKTITDNSGRPVTMRDALYSLDCVNLPALTELRALNPTTSDYKTKATAIKSKRLQLFAPSALLEGRKQVKQYTDFLQLDFDAPDLEAYDLEEVKQELFKLPFMAIVGLSCSGRGVWALVHIAEPEKLRQYAEHLFSVLHGYGIPADTSKGRNANDLRFVSWDDNLLIRNNPEPLKVTFPERKPKTCRRQAASSNTGGLLRYEIQRIRDAVKGKRWQSVQAASYAMGGKGSGLAELEEAIYTNPDFAGEHEKYLKCARDCFQAGQVKPI